MNANCDTDEKKRPQLKLKEKRVVFRYSLVDRKKGLER